MTSSVVPSGDANATAERLVRENAVLHIELGQLRDENKSMRALRNAAEFQITYRKHGLLNCMLDLSHSLRFAEEEINFLREELVEAQERFKKQVRMHAELSDDYKNIESEVCLKVNKAIHFPGMIQFIFGIVLLAF